MKNTIGLLFSLDLNNLPSGFSGSHNKSIRQVSSQKYFLRGKVPHNPGRAVESIQKRSENRGRFS